MVLLRDKVTNARNLTSSFILIESVSGMRISLDYQPIEVKYRRCYRKLRQRMQLQGQSYLNTEFCRKPSIDLRIAIRFKT